MPPNNEDTTATSSLSHRNRWLRGQDRRDLRKIPRDEYKNLIKDLTAQMNLASANLEFERAADLRDLIAEIREKM